MTRHTLDQALIAYRAGRFDEAAAQCRAALALAPRDEALAALLAMADHAAGRHDAAAESFEALTRWRPDAAEYWSNLGYMRRLAGRYGEAEAAFHRSLALDPRSYGTLLNLGLLLLDMGRFGAARHALLDAVALDPDAPMARIYGSCACFECGDARLAAELIPPPDTWTGLDAELRRDLAMALIHVGRTGEAERLLDPGATGAADPLALVHLALLYERTNRLEPATLLFERIKHHVEGSDRALRTHILALDSALAMRRGDYVHARSATTEMMRLELSVAAQASANFNLAMIADKLGEPDNAMRELHKAHAFQLRVATEIAPDIAGSDQEPLRIATRWLRPDRCRFAEDREGPDAAASPVFIVGFPRSGTTMLEQMLDAHPAYASMDEQLVLQHCIRQMEADGLRYPHDLDRLDARGVDRLRAAYWDEVARIVPTGDQRMLVDKNPLNLLRLPMIRRLFPSARIILALRHPCDVILSCYMQNFRSPAFMVLCSTLPRLARSYVNAMRSWIHHQQILKADVLQLRYEETVADFPAQVGRIADFLGLEDRGPLAGFSEHASRKGYISTPSYAQVVQPINARAVARWHAYRAYLEPALPILQPVAEHWGYDVA